MCTKFGGFNVKTAGIRRAAEKGSGPVGYFFFSGLLASRVDWLKIFTLNHKDCLSFAG